MVEYMIGTLLFDNGQTVFGAGRADDRHADTVRNLHTGYANLNGACA